MPDRRKPFNVVEYDRMADQLTALADAIRAQPSTNHQFSERLALLARQMREDCIRFYPNRKAAS